MICAIRYVNAAAKGDANAQYMMGMCMLRDPSISKSHAEQAVQLLLKSAQQENQWGYYGIGLVYSKSTFRSIQEPHVNQAVMCYKSSVKQGNAYSAYELGLAYEEGLEGILTKKTDLNQRRADILYQLAANQGHTKAIEKLNSPEYIQRNRGIIKGSKEYYRVDLILEPELTVTDEILRSIDVSGDTGRELKHRLTMSRIV